MPTPSNQPTGVRLEDGPQELLSKDAWSAAVAILREFHPNLTFDYLQQQQGRGLRVFGLVQDRILVGVATITTQLHLSEGERPWIEDLLIDPAHRNQGNGERLFRHVVDSLHNEGAQRVLVRTREENRRAIKFYLRMGCELSGPAFNCK